MMREKIYNYWFMEWIADEDNRFAYFSSINFNEFFKYDISKNEIISIGKYDKIKSTIQMFRGGVLIGKKIFFAPRMADKMVVYEIDKQTFYEVDIFGMFSNHQNFYFKPSLQGFISLKDENGNGWLIYGNSPICVKIDVNTQEISYITCKSNEEAYFLGTDYVVEDNILYVPVIGKSAILRLDMQQETVDYINIGNDDENYFSITKGGKGVFYLLSYAKPSIVVWDIKTNLVKRVADLPVESIKYDQSLWLRKSGDIIRVFPGLDIFGGNANVFTFNILTGQLREESVYLKYADYRKWPMQSINHSIFFFMTEKEENPFLTSKGKYVCYDWKNNNTEEVEFPVPIGEEMKSISEKIKKHEIPAELEYYNRQGICTEGEPLNIEQFLYGIGYMK